jgi:DNA-binding response OmpR family regulator
LSNVLLLTAASQPAAEILPSLSLLDHAVRVAPASASHLLSRSGGACDQPVSRPADGMLADDWPADAVLVDARHDLLRARQLFGQLGNVGVPVIAIITEGGWAAITLGWGADDVILHTAGPGEVEARIRLAIGRFGQPPAEQAAEVRSGELVIDEATYSARIHGAALDLTFKEFELLKFLAQHPRRVFTRSQLLQEVWGYDYFGGTRTVDVHVRRLRAKLGTGNEALIGTVRNVGYKFEPARPQAQQPAAHQATGSASPARPASPATSGPAATSTERPNRAGHGSDQRARR